MPNSIPATIRELREAQGLTPAEIERRTAGAVKRGALTAIELGKVPNPTFKTVAALAEVLAIDAVACHAAIAAQVAARQSGAPRRGPGRPPAAPVTLASALAQARQLCTALEQLADPGPQ